MAGKPQRKKRVRTRVREKEAATTTPAVQATPAAATTTPNGEIVELEAALRMLKTSRSTLYRWVRERRLAAMKAGRQWRFRRCDLERFLSGAAPRPALPVSAEPLVAKLSDALAASGMPSTDLPAPAGADPLQHAMELLFRLAVRRRASDIHIAPAMESGTTAGLIRMRRDGMLLREADLDVRLLPHLIERLKTMAGCDVLEPGRPQEGRLRWAQGMSEEFDLRASFMPTTLGPSVTVRVLHRADILPRLDDVGYTPQDLQRIEEALKLPNGLLLFTGPTGSGKTTILYSALASLVRPDLKVMSIEDPVEVIVPGVNQTDVRTAEGVTIARLLRGALRSDPDVIMAGEIRDLESLEVMCAAVETGHLVLTTMHTKNAADAFARLRDMGLEPYIAADVVKLVSSQRLIRILCNECARAVTVTAGPEFLWARQALLECGINEEEVGRNLREPVGCAKCARTGYHTRKLVAETWMMTPDIARGVRDSVPSAELRLMAIAGGMSSLAADAARKAFTGMTSLAEAFRVAGPPAGS